MSKAQRRRLLWLLFGVQEGRCSYCDETHVPELYPSRPYLGQLGHH